MRTVLLVCLSVALAACASRSSNELQLADSEDNHATASTEAPTTSERESEIQVVDPNDLSAVGYGMVRTPWDFCHASLSYDEERGIRFDLVWSGPGTLAPREEWDQHKSPERGEVAAAIIHNGEIVAEPDDNPPAIYGWAGGGLGTSGDMMMFFGWLPSGLGDCWIRVDMLDERHWFLIPRELHQQANGPVAITRPAKDEVVPPATADSDDKLHW